MLIDILNSNNYISFNIDAARIFGLNTAVYCSELLNIYKKAKIKNKLLEDDYFKVDRKYIFDRTTLSVEDQLKADINLGKISLIVKQKDNPDNIKFDFELYASLLSGEDKNLISNISKKIKIKSPKGTKATQREIIKNELKNSIQCSNYELLTALRDWVDAIYANPNNYLSKHAISIFQNTLNQYTNGDLDLALAIVNIAIAQGYRDCQWAINIYERDKTYKENNKAYSTSRLNNSPRVTEQKRAESGDIGDSF